MKPRRADEAAIPQARPAPDADAEPDAVAEPDDVEPDDDELDTDTPSIVDEAVPLDERSLQILDFERQWWKHAGAKEQAIRERFGLSATRYYQVLNALLDTPAALAHDPMLVGRLRRLRASRSRRSSG